MAPPDKLTRIIRYQPQPCPACQSTGQTDQGTCPYCNGKGTLGEPQPVTAAEVILEAVRTGNYIETAAAFADVDRQTIRVWVAEGARLRSKLETGETKRRDLSKYQRAQADFARDLMVANAEAEIRSSAQIASAGQLPQTVRTVTTTTKVVDGVQVVERIVREETRPPDWRAEAWRMEKRFSQRWGDHHTVEHVLGDPVEKPMDDRLSALIDRAEVVRGKILALPARSMESTNGHGSNGNGTHPGDDEVEEA